MVVWLCHVTQAGMILSACDDSSFLLWHGIASKSLVVPGLHNQFYQNKQLLIICFLMMYLFICLLLRFPLKLLNNLIFPLHLEHLEPQLACFHGKD